MVLPGAPSTVDGQWKSAGHQVGRDTEVRLRRLKGPLSDPVVLGQMLAWGGGRGQGEGMVSG